LTLWWEVEIMMKKELTDSLPLWKRLLALSGFLFFIGAALAFPRRDERDSSTARIVANLHVNVKPTRSEVAWVFRSYAKVTAAPRQFLMTGPVLAEKPLG
jgi:hypothetical protein